MKSGNEDRQQPEQYLRILFYFNLFKPDYVWGGGGEGEGEGVDWGKRDQESFARSSSDWFNFQFLLITTQKNWDSISEILRNDVK